MDFKQKNMQGYKVSWGTMHERYGKVRLVVQKSRAYSTQRERDGGYYLCCS